MKRLFILPCLLLMIVILIGGCLRDLSSQEDIEELFEKNEAIIVEAVQTRNFEKVERIRGIERVSVSNNYIDFHCDSAGFSSDTSYCGFFYSKDDDMTVWYGDIPRDDLIQDGDGFRWAEPIGDNHFYVEQIAEHFFYYEVHF